MEKKEQEFAGESGRIDDDAVKLRCYSSEQLFAGANEIEIFHQKERYRIRITRNGKLIMNK